MKTHILPLLASCCLLSAAALTTFAAAPAAATDETIASPDGRLVVTFSLDDAGAPGYAAALEGKPVLQRSRLGIVRDDADFSQYLALASASAPESVRDSYEILTAKRRHNTYEAVRRVFHLKTRDGLPLDIIFQVSNDGLAFRYYFPAPAPDDKNPSRAHRIDGEISTFHFLPGTRAWLQPMQPAKSGFAQTNPAYEEHYQRDIPAGTPSTLGAGWVFPALFRSGGTWLLVSEGSLPRNYCGSRLRGEAPDGEYSIAFPDPRERLPGGPVFPESTLPWLTPWRLVVVGSLKTIAESMLGVDLAEPPAPNAPAADPAAPGKASWSWVLLKDDKTDCDTQRRFVDYAADMGWRYCLVDALWDTQIGYEKIAQLAAYARTRGVSLLLWYNSAGPWNSAPQTPRDRMLTHESRMAEFARIKAMGVAGVKIDFFGGDGQSVIAYYRDIAEDAGACGLLVNFHGATLPRGWQRTYPQIMTMEAVKGLEFVTFEQANADAEPAHAAMLPFTRNVFDPMDFTPMVLDKIPNIERRTTPAFELALSVLFTSGIQHYGEIPEGMAKAPNYVRDLLKKIPSIWDDTRFIDGDPGKHVVLARLGNGRWHVAGINGENAPKTLTLDLSEITNGKPVTATLITDAETATTKNTLPFRKTEVTIPPDGNLTLTLRPAGGFILTLPPLPPVP